MKPLLANVLLALTWAAATGRAGPAELLFGYAIGYGVLRWLWPQAASQAYFRKVPAVVRLLGFTLLEIVRSNLRVAHDVLTPRLRSRPGIVAVPLAARTDTEIVLLSNLVTLTPGTMSLDVSTDRRVLYVHAMFVERPETIRTEIHEGFERRLLELLR